MKYSQYLELKEMVLNDETTVNFVCEFLKVPLVVARCLVKDWKEQQEEHTAQITEYSKKLHELQVRLERRERITEVASRVMEKHDGAFRRLAEYDKANCSICGARMAKNWSNGHCVHCDYLLGEGYTQEDIHEMIGKTKEKSEYE
jgi:hypothetical protein